MTIRSQAFMQNQSHHSRGAFDQSGPLEIMVIIIIWWHLSPRSSIMRHGMILDAYQGREKAEHGQGED